jgi:uncharacterized protein
MEPDCSGLVAIAVLAKAPVPGFAKTRLVSVLGLEGAAQLQARLIERATETACKADIGPVTLWTAPDQRHATFEVLRKRLDVQLARQPEGDLGARMLAAIAAARRPTLVIGTDCPVLTAAHLRMAADVLHDGTEVVVFPAEDGGYALIGARRPLPELFSDMPWSSGEVMAETRHRLAAFGLAWREPVTLWDVDVPEDLERLRQTGLECLLQTSQNG